MKKLLLYMLVFCSISKIYPQRNVVFVELNNKWSLISINGEKVFEQEFDILKNVLFLHLSSSPGSKVILFT